MCVHVCLALVAILAENFFFLAMQSKLGERVCQPLCARFPPFFRWPRKVVREYTSITLHEAKNKGKCLQE